MITEISVELSTGNVFADLGYDNPEEMSAKSEIVRNISKTITQFQIDHAKVAEIIGIKQSQVYDLIIGRLLHLPKDQLSQFLIKLTTMTCSNHPKAREILKLQEIVENGILSGDWVFDHETEGSSWDGYFSTKGFAKNFSRHFTVDISLEDGSQYNQANLIWKENDVPLLKAHHYEQGDGEFDDADNELKELIKTCLNTWISAKKQRVANIQKNLLANPANLQIKTKSENTEKEDFQPCLKLINEWILDSKIKYFLEKDLEELKAIYGREGLNKTFVRNTLSIVKQVFKYIILSNQDIVQEIEESNNEFKSIENLDEWNFDQLVQSLLDFNILDEFTVPISKVICLYGQSETEEIDANVAAIAASGLNVICRTIMR